MFFKSKKSHGSMKVLSETEIQKKLYGDYRDRFPKESRNFKSETREKVSLNIALQESEPQSLSGDLFRIPPVVTESSISRTKEETPGKESEQKAEQARMSRLANLAESEKRLQPKLKQEKSKTAVIKWSKVTAVFSAAFAALGSFLWTGIRGVGRVLFRACAIVLSLALRFARWFDFRRPEIRRITFGVLGLIGLFALFSSIHFLNVRREKAMKTSGSRVVASAKAAAKAPKVHAPVAESIEKTASGVQGGSAADSVSLNTVISEGRSSTAAGAVSTDSEASLIAAKHYVIQVATYSNSADADRIVKSLKEQGAAAFSKSLTRPSGKVYYSVFIGRYANFEQAQQNLESFRKKDASKSFQDAFIRTLD